VSKEVVKRRVASVRWVIVFCCRDRISDIHNLKGGRIHFGSRFLPIMLEGALCSTEQYTFWGSGSREREYLHSPGGIIKRLLGFCPHEWINQFKQLIGYLQSRSARKAILVRPLMLCFSPCDILSCFRTLAARSQLPESAPHCCPSHEKNKPLFFSL
jgi:hypothetical protein